MDFPPPGARPYLKICGLTREADMRLAWELGAAFLGLILTKKSARHLPLDVAEQRVAALRTGVTPAPRFVGVFVDESPAEIEASFHALNLFAVQVHNLTTVEELALPREKIIPAVSLGERASAHGEAIAATFPTLLLDSAVDGKTGGTGKTFDHGIAARYFEQNQVLVAGGIRPDNLSTLVTQLPVGHCPYGYDLSSGVESAPGIKDHQLLQKFFATFDALFPRS